MYKHIGIIGSNGTIGSALVEHLSLLYPDTRISTFSRQSTQSPIVGSYHYRIDYDDETSIEIAAEESVGDIPYDLIIIATGLLHKGSLQPEKSLKDLSADKFMTIFKANTIFPALVAKHFLPRMNKEDRAVFAALSARVGSISDNNLGGWYAYRSSKAALNMVLKNCSIEMSRRSKKMIIVGLHPGTVDSGLSKPFQNYVHEGHLFTAKFSAKQLIKTIDSLSISNTGKCFAWDGKEIFS